MTRTRSARVSLARIFKRDLIGTTIHCSLLAACFMVSYYSVTYWYARFLQLRGLNTLPFIIALNVGGIVGSAFWGGVSQGRLGRRGAVTCAAALGVVVSPALSDERGHRRAADRARCLWALARTACGARSRPTSPSVSRARYAAPAQVSAITPARWSGSFTSYAIGHLVDTGWTLASAMTAAIAVSGLAVALMIWLGPETRDRRFQ